MANVGYATLGIIPSTKGFGAALDKGVGPAGASSGHKIGGQMSGGILSATKGLAGPLAAAFGGAALIGGLKQSISLASDFSETLNKSNIIFGSSAKEIENFSKTSVRTLGLSQGAALTTAAQFGDMFKQIGFGAPQVSGLSQDFLKLSADIGSFQNADTGDVTSAFQSALRGEFESIQRFLPGLKGARIETEALALSGKTAAKQLTAQDKAMALYSLATKDGASASNDFAETQGGLAGQQKILSATIEDLQTKFGTLLLGAMTRVVSFINGTLVPGITRIKDVIVGVYNIFANGDFKPFAGLEEDSKIVDILFRVRDAAITMIDAFKTNVLPVLTTVGAFIRDNIRPILIVLAGALGGVLLGAVVTLGGVIGGALVGGLTALVGALASPLVVIGALVAGLIYAYNNFEGFRAVVQTVVAFITGTVVPAFLDFGAKVREAIGDAVAFVKEIWPQVRESIERVINAVKSVISAFVTVVTAAWKAWGDEILSLAKAAFDFIKTSISNALDLIKGVIRTVLAVINGDWGKAWDGLKAIISAFWEQVKNIVNLAWEVIKTLFSAAFSAIKLAVSAGWEATKALFSVAWTVLKAVVSAGIDAVVDFVKALPGKFVSGLSTLASSLKGVATTAWNAFDSAVDTGIAAVLTVIRALPGKIVSGLGNLGSTLRSAGGDLLRGLANGIGEAIGDVVGAAVRAAKAVVDAVKGALGINSPSKVFAELGGFVGQGFANGIDGMADKAQASLAAMVAPPSVADMSSDFGASRSVAGAQSTVALSMESMVAQIDGLRAEVRRQTDRGLLLTRTGVTR